MLDDELAPPLEPLPFEVELLLDGVVADGLLVVSLLPELPEDDGEVALGDDELPFAPDDPLLEDCANALPMANRAAAVAIPMSFIFI